MPCKYSYEPPAEIPSAKAQVTDVDASFKDLCQVCNSIRSRNAASALAFLELAAKGERAVLYRNHNKKKGHRHELRGKKGGYPKKAAGIVLGVLKNALANADKNGLQEPMVRHAAANKMNSYPRLSPKGKRNRSDFETARVELVLEEKREVAAQKKKEVAKKKEEAAKAIERGSAGDLPGAPGKARGEQSEPRAIVESAKKEAEKK